ncbi:hypothetical protein CUMW_215490, partial [Citrus unshiu]
MLRSTNSSRVAERLIIDSTPSPSHNERANTDTDQQLPTYDPRSDVAKKERSRIRFAENAIHAIPLLLVFCAVVLWFFSKPGPDLVEFASFLARTTASSRAQQAPCPRFGVMGCHASPTSTTLPLEAGGLVAGHSQRSTRGVLMIVSSGVRSMLFNSSAGQFLTRSLACFFNATGSIRTALGFTRGNLLILCTIKAHPNMLKHNKSK